MVLVLLALIFESLVSSKYLTRLTKVCRQVWHTFTMPRTPCAKNWCFTWNNYPANYEEIIREAMENLYQTYEIRVVYLVAGQEVAETGTPHLQGFLQCDQRLANPAQRLWQCHWEVSLNVVRSALYCKKGMQTHAEWLQYKDRGPNFGAGAVLLEIGALSQKKGSQGKRTDLHALRETIKAAFDEGNIYSEKDARDDFPDVIAKYPHFVKQSIADFKPQVTVEPFPLRPWQQELNGILNRPADNRQVIFVVDIVGNSGKTWFSKYYRQNHENVQLISPGKYADMAYMVNEFTRVFFIDAPREKIEFFNYYFLEKLKDRDVFSTKYYPEQKELHNDAHVVVLMNCMPDMTKLSADRYKIINTEGRNLFEV